MKEIKRFLINNLKAEETLELFSTQIAHLITHATRVYLLLTLQLYYKVFLHIAYSN